MTAEVVQRRESSSDGSSTTAHDACRGSHHSHPEGGSKPPVWRCIHVTSATTHGAPGLLGELDVEDARTVPLETLVPRETCKCLYEDEVGERWEHERLVDKRLPLQEGQRYSVGLTGKRARPPEGGGGIWGYAGVLEGSALQSIPSMTRWSHGWG